MRLHPIQKEALLKLREAVEKTREAFREAAGQRHYLIGVADEPGKTDLYWAIVHIESELADMSERAKKELLRQ